MIVYVLKLGAIRIFSGLLRLVGKVGYDIKMYLLPKKMSKCQLLVGREDHRSFLFDIGLLMLDSIIEEAIATGKPIEFKRDDLEEKRFRIVSGASVEIEKEINRLGDIGYVPVGGLSCTYTSHGLVYAQLMENLYYNPITNDTQVDYQNSEDSKLGSSDGEGKLPGTRDGETSSGGYDGEVAREVSGESE